MVIYISQLVGVSQRRLSERQPNDRSDIDIVFLLLVLLGSILLGVLLNSLCERVLQHCTALRRRVAPKERYERALQRCTALRRWVAPTERSSSTELSPPRQPAAGEAGASATEDSGIDLQQQRAIEAAWAAAQHRRYKVAVGRADSITQGEPAEAASAGDGGPSQQQPPPLLRLQWKPSLLEVIVYDAEVDEAEDGATTRRKPMPPYRRRANRAQSPPPVPPGSCPLTTYSMARVPSPPFPPLAPLAHSSPICDRMMCENYEKKRRVERL